MPLPLTSYQLPHPVLPKPKKGCTHQPLRTDRLRHHPVTTTAAYRVTSARTSWPGKQPAYHRRLRGCALSVDLDIARPGRHQGLAPDSLFQRIGGGGGRECRGRSPRGTERRRWMFTNCGSAIGAGSVSISTGSAASLAGMRRVSCPAELCLVCREEADTPEHVLLRCPCLAGARHSQNTRHNLHDTDAAAGRWRRRRLGPRPQTRRSRWLPDGRRKKQQQP